MKYILFICREAKKQEEQSIKEKIIDNIAKKMYEKEVRFNAKILIFFIYVYKKKIKTKKFQLVYLIVLITFSTNEVNRVVELSALRHF